jgi:hypothetical protein
MDTAQEALFKAMLNDGWFTTSDGDVQAPTGFFGYTVNTKAELPEILEAFTEVTGVYGLPSDEQLLGVWFAVIGEQGTIRIEKLGALPDDITTMASLAHPHTAQAKARFEALEREYSAWAK